MKLQDERRDADRDRAAVDNAMLFQKWDLPERNTAMNEFDQTRPCTLKGLRAAQAA